MEETTIVQRLRSWIDSKHNALRAYFAWGRGCKARPEATVRGYMYHALCHLANVDPDDPAQIEAEQTSKDSRCDTLIHGGVVVEWKPDGRICQLVKSGKLGKQMQANIQNASSPSKHGWVTSESRILAFKESEKLTNGPRPPAIIALEVIADAADSILGDQMPDYQPHPVVTLDAMDDWMQESLIEAFRSQNPTPILDELIPFLVESQRNETCTKYGRCTIDSDGDLHWHTASCPNVLRRAIFTMMSDRSRSGWLGELSKYFAILPSESATAPEPSESSEKALPAPAPDLPALMTFECASKHKCLTAKDVQDRGWSNRRNSNLSKRYRILSLLRDRLRERDALSPALDSNGDFRLKEGGRVLLSTDRSHVECVSGRKTPMVFELPDVERHVCWVMGDVGPREARLIVLKLFPETRL